MAQTVVGPVVAGLNITGTPDRDRITGGAGDDTLVGGDGKDKLKGLDGDDLLLGEGGRDRLYGGADCDTLRGGDGDDRLDGGADDDSLDGGAGDDRMRGRDGDDSADGGDGDDTLHGNDGDDTLIGGLGDDRLYGGRGDDDLRGGDGHDRLKGDKGHDRLDGGTGNDRLAGGKGDDTLTGGAGDDRLRGGNGDDTLIYVLADNSGAQDRYDGDKGYDTLRIEMTGAEWQEADTQAQVSEIMDFLSTQRDCDSGTGATEVEYRGKIDLSHFGMTLSDIENVVFVVDGVDYGMSDPIAMDDRLAGPGTGEVQINSDLTNQEVRPAVAALSTGQIAVTWTMQPAVQDGTAAGIKARIINADGTGAGAEFTVNTDFSGIKDHPAITALSGGQFAIAWQSDADTGVAGNSTVLARIFFGDGSPASDVFTLSQTTPGDDPRVSLTTLTNGTVLSVWESGAPVPGPAQTQFSARFLDASGAALGSEFAIANPYSGSLLFPQATALSDGTVLLVQQASQTPNDTSGSALIARVIDDTGAEVIAPWTVNTATFSHQANPRAAELTDGTVAILWTSEDGGADPLSIGVRARIFNKDGTEAVAEFQVNSEIDSAQHQAEIVALDTGQFAAVWRSISPNEAGGKPAIKARIFDADGSEAVPEFAISDSLRATQETPSVTALSGGRFMVAWQNFGGSNSYIVTRVFNADGTESETGLTDAQTPVTIDLADLLSNDMDPNSDALSLHSLDAGALQGSLTDLGGGLYQYDPTGAFNDLPAGDLTTDSFDCTITDGNGGLSTATATIVVQGTALPLFSPADEVVNFGGQAEAAALPLTLAGDYLDGTQYAGGAGRDEVWLPDTLADAAAAGYDPTQVFDGGDGNDALFGGALDDEIHGGAGNDVLRDRNTGNNTLLGGDGNDTFQIGVGNNHVDGGAGTNTVRYDRDGPGVTIDIDAGTGTGQGTDVLLNLSLFETSNQDDVVHGSVNAMRVFLRDGNDAYHGSTGVEEITPGAGDDTVDGGGASDRVSFDGAATGVTVDLGLGTATGEGTDTLIGIEQVYGSLHDDLLIGDSTNTEAGGVGDNFLGGLDGNDTLFGLDGRDLLLGGDGDDLLYGGEGDDQLAGGDGVDLLDGGNGTDRLYYIQHTEAIEVDLAAGTLIQFGVTDTLVSIEDILGSNGDDTLTGDAGDNQINGWKGADILTGGAGADEFLFSTNRGFDDEDIITDFEIGVDIIHLFGSPFASLVDLAPTQVAGDTRLTLVDGETVLLQGILVGDLSDSDFIF